MAEDRARRISLNEAMFREVNERLEEISARVLVDTNELDLVCECGDTACAVRIRVAPETYEQVRSDSARFLVAPGHVAQDVEHVIEEGDGYQVLQKDPGVPARVAEATDTRS